MRIVFICGSLDPGKNGVGDYARNLAAECTRQGHSCMLVSINDCKNDTYTSDSLVIRRNKALLTGPENQRIQVVKTISDWRPDWISLQFVCFAFHPKGFLYRLQRFTRLLPDNISRHLMLHELWVLNTPQQKLKLRLLGCIQRPQILRLIRNWKPRVTHTSNAYYQALLRKQRVNVEILPLFGNLKIEAPSPDHTQRHLNWLPAAKQERIVIIPFSQFDHWNYEHTFKRLFSLAQQTPVSLKIVQVGVDRRSIYIVCILQ